MAKTLFKIAITDEDLGEWLDEMYEDEDEEFDEVDFRNDLDKVCKAAAVDCGGRTALTDWMWGHVSYDYIKNELEDAVKEYMAATLRGQEW